MSLHILIGQEKYSSDIVVFHVKTNHKKTIMCDTKSLRHKKSPVFENQSNTSSPNTKSVLMSSQQAYKINGTNKKSLKCFNILWESSQTIHRLNTRGQKHFLSHESWLGQKCYTIIYKSLIIWSQRSIWSAWACTKIHIHNASQNHNSTNLSNLSKECITYPWFKISSQNWQMQLPHSKHSCTTGLRHQPPCSVNPI